MFFAFGPEIGYQALTSSGVVNDSGKPQALYGIAINASGTSAIPTFFDGTSSLGTAVFAQSGIAAGWANFQYSTGLVFPKGLYVSFDANTTKVTTWCRQVLT
jgi:hypothetical protein